LKHLGGCVVPSCVSFCITDYTYYYKDLSAHKAIFSLYRQFNFCPFCGKPIELPWWMTDEDAWQARYGKVPDNHKDI
jgi:hypothetical protein